jgi:hypothetical protein
MLCFSLIDTFKKNTQSLKEQSTLDGCIYDSMHCKHVLEISGFCIWSVLDNDTVKKFIGGDKD